MMTDSLQSTAVRLRLTPAEFALPLAMIAYALLILPLRGWIVDDSAISMAYAANWSSGHGLVPQPGMPQVEGYSDFLWVVILAILNLAGIMTPLAIKLTSFVLVSLSLTSLNNTCERLMPPYARLVVLLLVATNSSIVTWTTSGLENPLTLLLTCELLRVVSRSRKMGIDDRSALYAGALVAALGVTRPEGIVFAIFPPLALFERRNWRSFLIYGAMIALLYGAFLAFRVSTFHDWVPNTFYAKDAHSLRPFLSLLNLATLLNGPLGSGIILVALAVLAYVKLKGDDRLVAPLWLMVVAAGVFALMPADWMPDRRFGTPFVPAACVFAGIVLGSIDRAKLALLATVVAIALVVSGYRLASMYRDPTMPAEVVLQTSRRFEQIADQRGLNHASVLMPDIGAALLHSKLRVYDLAGLTDRTIGRTLHSNKQRFHDYIFEELRPTFIRTHGPWAELADFDSDPRFRRDYVAIRETIDPWLKANRGLLVRSGDYVRISS